MTRKRKGSEGSGSDEQATAPAAPPAALEGQAGARDSAPANDPARIQATPQAVVVTGPRGGRWRAGRRFGPDPVRIDLSDLTDQDRAAIAGDPLLSVEEV